MNNNNLGTVIIISCDKPFSKGSLLGYRNWIGIEPQRLVLLVKNLPIKRGVLKMLYRKWRAIRKTESLYIYSLATVSNAVLKANHVKPLTDYQRNVINTYLMKSRHAGDYVTMPREVVKLFSDNNKGLDVVAAYYRNQKRNHKLITNFRRYLISTFQRLVFTDKTVDTVVHLYTLMIDGDPSQYRIVRAKDGKYWIISPNGMLSYKQWVATTRKFKNNYLKRKPLYLLGGMPHCKPNLLTTLEIHEHLALFSFKKIDTAKESEKISAYFTNRVGLKVKATVKPMRNVVTRQPITFDKNNYDEPLHVISSHDLNYLPHRKQEQHQQHEQVEQEQLHEASNGNNYDSVEDEANISGKDSDPLSTPDPDYKHPEPSMNAANDDKPATAKEQADVQTFEELGLRKLAIYVLATLNSSYKVRRRFMFSYKNTKAFSQLKDKVKGDLKTVAVADMLGNVPQIDDQPDRVRAVKALNSHRARIIFSQALALQPWDVISSVWDEYINCPETSYFASLHLNFDQITKMHQTYIQREARQNSKQLVAVMIWIEFYISELETTYQIEQYIISATNKQYIRTETTDRTRHSGIPP